MLCIIGPLFVYWSSNSRLQDQWIFLKAEQKNYDSNWIYCLLALNSESELIDVPLDGTVTCYVADKQSDKSYALILQPAGSQDNFIAEPLRVIFAKNLGSYLPRPFAELWKGASQDYWVVSQQHRSARLSLLYPEHFRPYADFDALYCPKPLEQIIAPKESIPHEITFASLIEALEINDYQQIEEIPLVLRHNCAYLMKESPSALKIIVQFYEGVRLEKNIEQEQQIAELQQILDYNQSQETQNLDKTAALVTIDALIWGLSASQKHTIISVLAPDWIATDPQWYELSVEQQQIVFAYLIKRAKPQPALPLFLQTEAAVEYCDQAPYTEYLLYDIAEPEYIQYHSGFGVQKRWQLRQTLENLGVFEIEEAHRLRSGNSYYLVTENTVSQWLAHYVREAPFPRSFHPSIQNFIHQYLLPSGVAALFVREWSSPTSDSPCVGHIDTYYQYVLLMALRRYGYAQQITLVPLNELTACQRICELQQHFGVERLIYQGLNQRGLYIYQSVMGPIYNTSVLEEYDLQQLNDFEYSCRMILQRQHSDHDLFEASHDILATVAVMINDDRDEDLQYDIDRLQQTPQQALEEMLQNVLEEVPRYRFNRQFEQIIKEKYDDFYYNQAIKPAISLFFDLVNHYRPAYLRIQEEAHSLWYQFMESCLDMMREGPISPYQLKGYFIARSRFAESYGNEYPVLFFNKLNNRQPFVNTLSLRQAYEHLQQFPDNIIVPHEYQNTVRHYQRTFAVGDVVLSFFNYALNIQKNDAGRFYAVISRLEQDSFIDNHFLTEDDRLFYLSILKYINISDSFYKKLSTQHLFANELETLWQEYHLQILPYIQQLSQTNLFLSTTAHFFSRSDYSYDIPASRIRRILEIQANTPVSSASDNIFNRSLTQALNKKKEQMQQKMAEGLLDYLWQTSNARHFSHAILKNYCAEIHQISASFLHKVIKKSSFEQLQMIVSCFHSIPQIDEQSACQIKYLYNFMTFIVSISADGTQDADFAYYNDKLHAFFEQNVGLIQILATLPEIERQELIAVVEKFFDSTSSALTLAAILSSYHRFDTVYSQEVMAWALLFKQILIKRIITLSKLNLTELKNLLEKNSPVFIEPSDFISQASTVSIWYYDDIFQIIPFVPYQYWQQFSDVVQNNTTKWSHLFRDSSKHGELVIITLKALELFQKVFAYSPHEIKTLIEFLHHKEDCISSESQQWLKNFWDTTISMLDTQERCDDILSALKKYDCRHLDQNQALAVEEELLPETSLHQRDDSVAPLLHSEFLKVIMDSLERHLELQKIQISQKQCDQLARSFLMRCNHRFAISVQEKWAQVFDLKKEYLLNWLALFQHNKEAVDIILAWVLKLPSVVSGSINLWAVFSEIEWNTAYYYQLLYNYGYQISFCSKELRSIDFILERLSEKKGIIEKNFESVLEGFADRPKGMLSFCRYLIQHHLVFCQEWVPVLLQHMRRNISSWLTNQDDFILAVCLLKIQNITTIEELRQELNAYFVSHQSILGPIQESYPIRQILCLRDMTLINRLRQLVFEQPPAIAISQQPALQHELVSQFDSLAHFMTVAHREEYCAALLPSIRQYLIQNTRDIGFVFRLAAYLTPTERELLEPAMIEHIQHFNHNELAAYFEELLSHYDKTHDFIKKLAVLPPNAQLYLVTQGLINSVISGRELGSRQFFLWKNIFFDLLNVAVIKNEGIEILTHKFELLLQQYRLFQEIVSEPPHEDTTNAVFSPIKILLILWNLKAKQYDDNPSIELLFECIDLIKMINTKWAHLMTIPSYKILVQDILRAATSEMMTFWDIKSYKIIDNAHIFEKVYNHLTPARRKKLWDLCETDFAYWVQDINAFQALLRCADTVHQKILLERFTLAHNWIRNINDFCCVLKALKERELVLRLIESWPIDQHLYNEYDCVELLQQLHYFQLAPSFFTYYRDDFYAIGRPSIYVPVAQLSHLNGDSCFLIKLIQKFPEEKLGLRLVEMLIVIENLFALSHYEQATLDSILARIRTHYDQEWAELISTNTAQYWVLLIQRHTALLARETDQLFEPLLFSSAPTNTPVRNQSMQLDF